LSHGVLRRSYGLETTTLEHLAFSFGFGGGGDGGIARALGGDFGGVGFTELGDGFAVEGAVGVVDSREEFGVGGWW
jgi:hypothetical protein